MAVEGFLAVAPVCFADISSGFPARVVSLSDTLLYNLGASAEARNAAPTEQCDKKTANLQHTGLWIVGKGTSLMTRIRLGSQEFPDRKKECSFLASLNLRVRMTPLVQFYDTRVEPSLAPCAQAIPSSALHILLRYSLLLSPRANTGLI